MYTAMVKPILHILFRLLYIITNLQPDFHLIPRTLIFSPLKYDDFAIMINASI